MPVITGAAEYPEDILEKYTAQGVKIDALDALSLAEQAGSVRTVNIVLMGRRARYLDIPYEKWLTAIERSVRERFVEMNKKAFALGYNS